MCAAIAMDGERVSVPTGDPPFRRGAPAAYDVIIDPVRPHALRTTVKLIDRGAVVTYRLGGRGNGHRWAFGFTEYAVEADGSTSTTPVSAAEVMAVAREVGRDHEVEAMVEAAIPFATVRNARRLRAELA